jgi:flagellar hook-associated protein 2
VEQERYFTVKQTAQADRFLSIPLNENLRVEGGNYVFSLGGEEISFDYRGGSLKDFVDALNRRGRDKIQASLIAVRPGTKSLLIEGKLTGEQNRLGFSGAAEIFGQQIGMIEAVSETAQNLGSGNAAAGQSISFPVNPGVPSSPSMVLKFDTSTTVRPSEASSPQPPPGPEIPPAGSVSYGGIVIENDSSSITLPTWTPPLSPSPQTDDMNLVSLLFSDGSSVDLPPLSDSDEWNSHTYRLSDFAVDKTVVSIEINNRNTHRDLSLQDIQVYDASSIGGVRPLNSVSTAQDAIITMEGIEIQRPTNDIDDLIPGVTVNIRTASDRPVKLGVEPDREAVKDALISLVGNYNRLMAEINVLTRTDSKVIEELSYLSKEEQDDYKKRLGAFQSDITLSQFRSNLQRVISASYPTSAERDLALLAQIGIGTDVRRGGASSGYDPSRLRGYLEIDEKALDAAMTSKLSAIKELFGNDTDGDLLADTGVAFVLEAMTKPYVETGGFVALKTGTVDNRIDQEQRRIQTLDRQLTARETELKIQYGRMESAYNTMEQMSGTLDRFSEQNSSNNR